MNALHFPSHTLKIMASIVLAIFASQALAHRSSIDRIVAFGGSLSDNGNSFYWLSQPENQKCGVAVTKPPYTVLDQFLVPDGPYAIGGNRYAFSNGQTWLESFARYMKLAPSVRPVFASSNKKFTNYAVGGARSIANFYCRVNLPEQLQEYFADFKNTSPKTLVTLEFGGNDIRDALLVALNQQDPVAYLENAIKSINQALNALYTHGARRFMVMNVPDLGTTPAIRMIPVPGAASSATFLTRLFNENLLSVLKGMQKLPGSKVILLDVYGKFDDVVKHAEDYGFSNAKDTCIKPHQQCDNPDAYVFWDGVHPTEAVHEIIAQQAVNILTRH